jgi:hypothetical protein
MRTLCQEGFYRQPLSQAAFASSEAAFASFKADQVEEYRTMAGSFIEVVHRKGTVAADC